jgi:hypothetical protein
MSRNHPPDSNRRAALASGQKIDTPALVVLALTLFFATLFATLLVLRPEASDPTEPLPVGSRVTQSASRVNPPSVSAAPPSAPPVSAAPLEPIPRAEPKPEPKPDPTLQTQLEQLGIKCAEGANCYPD